jgi:universal stress protein E
VRNLLVVVSDPENTSYLFEKVGQLAGAASGLKIHVVQVIHEAVADLSIKAIDGSTSLKSFILSAAESLLEDVVEPLRLKYPDLETATLWNARTWEGILHAAERTEADLIIKNAGSHHRLGDVVRTPDDWNLLRHSEVAVMLVKEDAWAAQTRVLCALDPFDDDHEDLNMALLKQAEELAGYLGGDLDLVCAYPLFEPWVGELGAAANYVDIKNTIENEIKERVAALTQAAGISYHLLLLEEGHPAHALALLTESAAVGLLVIGTHARDGVTGVVLGNTSERILYHVPSDVVTVPAPKS